jgi:hypothetical protein
MKRTITETVEEYNDQGILIKKTTTVTEENDVPVTTPVIPTYPFTPAPINPQYHQPVWRDDKTTIPQWKPPYEITCDTTKHSECNAKESESR